MSHVRESVNRALFALLVAGWAWISPALAAAGDPEPLILAQAPDLAAHNEVAAAAAPRPGQGESALIGVAPAPAPPPENDPAPAPAGASAPPAPGAQPPSLGTGLRPWTIPPIRWGGYLALDRRQVTAQGQPRRTQLVESANFKASSYLWQPWFAQVSGELNLVKSQERGGERATGASGATGGGQLALFPVSRFPFTAAYSETRSSASGELTNNAYTSRRWGLTQSYAPPEGGSSYRLSYNRSDLTSEAFGTDTAKSLAAGMNWSGGFNTLSVNGNSYTNTRSNSGDTSSVNTLYSTHSYRPRPTFSIESLANYSANDYHLASGAVPTDFRSRFVQLNSFATWRPDQSSPLFLSGGVRLFQTGTGVNGAEVDATTMSVNAAASYALNRNTTLSGAGTATQVSNADRETTYTQQTAGIDYASDISKLGAYSYSWNTGANLGNQTGDESDKQHLGGRIGHRVNRSISLDERSALFGNASQSYSVIEDSAVSRSQTLTHSAGTSWSRRAGEAATTLVGLDVSDSRTRGYAAQHFQLVNLQASGQVQLSRWSSAGANMTIQHTRQTIPAERSTTSMGGNLSYQHMRAFNVAGLRYYALLNVNQQRERSRLEGDINAPLEQVNWSFEQRLEYKIGRLETQLSMRFAEIGGRNNGMIFFRVLRRFGEL